MRLSVPVRDESMPPTAVIVDIHFKTIYILRSRCGYHDLDKMDTFVLIPNATVDQMYRKFRSLVRKAFPQKYGCRHRIKFTSETATDYRWDTKLNQAVEIQS